MTEFKRLTTENVITTFCLTLAYFLFNYFVVGWGWHHLQLWLLLTVMYFAHPMSRKFFYGYLFFLIYGLIYDSMKAYPNYWFAEVRIESLYLMDKAYFGIEYLGRLLTFNEYAMVRQSIFLDLLAGFFYLNWMPVPILFGVYLFFTDRSLLVQFYAAFLFVNLIGFVVYYIYPAAPPWYYSLYGNTQHFDIGSNAAGLARFDEYFGIHLFEGIYSKGSNVFAAMPSMHSAYPLLVLFFSFKLKRKFLPYVFIVFTLGTWFAAIYTSHHYVIDVVMGAVCGGLGVLIFDWLRRKTVLGSFLKNYQLKYVS